MISQVHHEYSCLSCLTISLKVWGDKERADTARGHRKVKHWDHFSQESRGCVPWTPLTWLALAPSPPFATPQQGPSHPFWGCSRGLERPLLSCTEPFSSLCSLHHFRNHALGLTFSPRKGSLNCVFFLSRRPVLWLTLLGMATWPVSAGSRGPLRGLGFPLK